MYVTELQPQVRTQAVAMKHCTISTLKTACLAILQNVDNFKQLVGRECIYLHTWLRFIINNDDAG